MSKRFNIPFNTLALLTLAIGMVHFASSVCFSADTYSVPQTAEVTLAWDPNDPAPDGYYIYQRTDGQSYEYSQPCWTGPGTSGSVYNLDWDTNYYFVVRAYDGALESADSEEVSFVARSPEPTTYTISSVAGEHGSISPGGTVVVPKDSDFTVTIIPESGYHVLDVKVDGQSKGAISSYTFSAVTTNHTIDASFTVDAYVLSAAAGANGNITPAADTFAIAATAGSNGRIIPTGVADVIYGSSQTYTFVADEGFHISDLFIDGRSFGALESYTFRDVREGHTIGVNFVENTAVNIRIEAEDGDLQLPIGIADDETASAGGYVWAPTGSGTFISPSANAGFAEYHFDVPETGDYVVWGRQISNDTSSDSFFVSIDGQADMVWHTKLGGRNLWTWDVVSNRNYDDVRDASNPTVYRLTKGAHTLTIRQREDGTKLDRLLITNEIDMSSPKTNKGF